ncbi:radical SAM protein [Rathayibacter sp. Leaf296]|uniref:radical SAM protein n=1 Tax=Rathayibacter sp. Leaf296 TaxID=1736327 RepID=UPI00070255EA|nr:radical SAM protein [Rathayibacter sp. Leaf296]KQQ07561.1 radical SAM protein [Rathayibacter sp. Leaf296]
MSASFTPAQQLKFSLLADGAVISPSAQSALDDIVHGGELSPADYASTSGLIIRMEDDVWVNMPVERYNPNFVPGTTLVFDHGSDGFFVHGRGFESSASYWVPPSYLGGTTSTGRPLNNYVFTHGDRVRLSPTIGCAMVCDFCNIPFDDRYAGLKPVEIMLESVRTALGDELQPGRHLLISGGTPGPPHVPAMREAYEAVLQEFAGLEIDIMMVPLDGLYDLPRLDALGLHEISINLEVYSETIAQKIMPHKFRQGRSYYLDFLATAAEEIGGHRVRSMLMVGLEPLESTLEGVEAILERGCRPVLSPFRPDPATPLRDSRPPSAEELREVFLRASDLADSYGIELGPDCPPDTHNTLTLSRTPVEYRHELPVMFSGV